MAKLSKKVEQAIRLVSEAWGEFDFFDRSLDSQATKVLLGMESLAKAITRKGRGR